jgi:UDP-glucuronate 4-epimerase
MMSKKILITGAAGFIGSHLSEKLLEYGHTVLGIDNFDDFYPKAYKEANLRLLLASNSFEFVTGDFGSEGDLNKFSNKPDIVIHLAAKAGVQPSLQTPANYIETNITKLVFASSSSVYGNTLEIPFKETQDVGQPVSPYAFTKRSCELMNYTYHQLYNFDIINLRFFTVYGERQRPDLAIHKFVAKILKNEPIHLYGDGSTSRDYTYWADTVKGIIAAMQLVDTGTNIFEIINLGNNSPVTLQELVDNIGEVMQVKPQIVYEGKKPGDVDITYADISKAKKLLGYSPDTALKTGLANFLAWYLKINNTVS